MKKVLIVIFSMILIFSLCACGVDTTDNLDATSKPSENQSQRPDDDYDDYDDEYIDSAPPVKNNGSRDSYMDYTETRLSFTSFIIENSINEEAVLYNQSLVLPPELEVFAYLTPLLYWGEVLDNIELEQKEIIYPFIAGEDKRFRSIDIQRKNKNFYTATMRTDKDEQIIINVENHPGKDAVRLEAEKDGEQVLVFEYAKTNGGYAAQYYFDTVIGGTYGSPERAMSVFRVIFSGNDGSLARFDDVEEPTSLVTGVPSEQDFIKGATHWLTVKNGKFTGELAGEAF